MAEIPAELESAIRSELEHMGVRPPEASERQVRAAMGTALRNIQAYGREYYTKREGLERRLRARRKVNPGAPPVSYAVPRKAPAETWVEYHDRLAYLAKEALAAGAKKASEVLQRKAGEVAAKHAKVRKKAGSKSEGGPGTYPWEACIAAAKKKSKDPAAVCGAIRAASKRKYPAYWQARDAKKRKKNPSEDEFLEETYTAMEAASMAVADALSTPNRKKALEHALSAAMYAGSAVNFSWAAGDRPLNIEAKELAKAVKENLLTHLDSPAPAAVAKNPRKPTKKKKKKAKRKRSVASFMRI